MKKIALFMSALALVAFASCDNDNDEPNLDDVVEDGFFVAGPATGSDVLAPKFMMTAGINEVDKAPRDGMYEKYIVLEAGKDFYLTLNEAGESLRYSAELQDINLADRTGEAAYADNPAIVIRKGQLIDGPEAPAMQVKETGLYHIVLDLNKAGDLEFPQIIVVPCQWGVRGINGDWGFKAMELTSTEGGKYVYSINFQNMAASTFKFAYCDGWKITLDVDGKVKAETSLGEGLKAGGADISIKPGADVTINFTFALAAGDHSKSYTWKAEGVNENYSPADFTIGVSGDLHASVGNWSTPEGATLAVYNEAESDPANGTYVYYMEACPFKANAQFKFRKDGDWIAGNDSRVNVSGVTVSGTDNLTFGGEAGTYKVKFTLTCDGLTVTAYKAEFTRTGDLPAVTKDPKALLIGISGSINGWLDPLEAGKTGVAAYVSEADGIYTYKIAGLTLAANDELKFRFDGSWEGFGFAPIEGITFADNGGNLKVEAAAAGTYDVEMSFKWDSANAVPTDKAVKFIKK